jgi:hypothetical protein
VPAPRIAPTLEALAALTSIAEHQGGLVQWSQAVEAGLSTSQVRTLVRSGEWTRLRHGVLVRARESASAPAHFLDCAARWLSLPGDVVLSHDSAAVLHGSELMAIPDKPTFTIARDRRGALRSPGVGVVLDQDRTRFNGIPITSRERTLADVLRAAGSRERAQELADEAARGGLPGAAMADVFRRQRGWPGIVQAREAWAFASPLSESPLESRCRVWFRDGGLPEAEQQVRIADRAGTFARVDFLFRDQRTVVEADGRVKYDVPAVLWQEKRREDRLRETNLEVVRATWADGDDGGSDLVARVHRAFARAARAA